MKNTLLLAPIFIALTSYSFTAFSSQSAVNFNDIKKCRAVKNDKNRLLCYDKAVMGKQLSTAKTQPQKKPTDDFGIEHKDINGDRAEQIKARVSSVAKSLRGNLTITLDNHQVWKQTSSERFSLKTSDNVKIKRGVFNSFLLIKEGQNRGIRVKRIK